MQSLLQRLLLGNAGGGGGGNPTLNYNFVDGSAFPSAITFTRTGTNATYFNSAGVLTSAGADVPRFDYNPATLAAQGLLIEEARTNSLPRSEEFSDASWTKGGTTVTADSTTAPSGTTTADTLTEDTSTGQHRVYRTTSGTTNTNPYTVSFFAKASTRTRVYVGIAEGTTFVRQGNAIFDLSAGTVVNASSGTGGATGGSATIQNVGNGWYRCTYTLTLGGTDTSIFCDINLVSTGTTINYTGNGTGAIFLWGAQLEAGAFPTSYIPTTTTALTRSADVASVNTLSPWYNATEGTLFVQALRGDDVDATIATFAIGSTTADRIQIHSSTSSEYRATYRTGNVEQAALLLSSSTNSPKIAATIKTNDLAASINGASPQTDTTASIAAYDTLWIGRRSDADVYWNGHIQRITYYPVRLTNAALQQITT